MSRVPHDAVAERALVSALLGGQIDMDSLIGQIADADFYVPANRATFQAMLSLHEAQRAIDMVTVIGELTRLGTLEVAGGASAIGGMQAVDGANPDEYARQVRDCSQLRRLVDVAEEIRVRAGHGASPGSIVSYAEEEILKITVGRDRGEPVLAGELLARVLGEIEAACKTRNPVTGLATGFTDVDNYLGGLQPADLVIVGGRPSMGKTAFGMNIAVNAALAGARVLVFSLEMSKHALVKRVVSSESRVDSVKMRVGRVNEDDWRAIRDASEQIYGARLLIDDTGAATVGEMRSKARRTRARYGLDLVVVDYIQLCRAKAENRNQEVSAISRGLKALAKELDAPVMALSQLNRSLESRSDKRPLLSDLKESGDIEQDADVVLFPYRPYVYDPGVDPAETEMIVAKQRNGPIGTCRLRWDERIVRFDNAARHYIEARAQGEAKDA